MNEEYLKVVQGGRPVPGQSLTTDPENPAPYERPPKYTSVHEASEDIFGYLIQPEVYADMMMLLDDDMPIMDVVQSLLFYGFTEGKWNPDLMLMLVEPVAYMLLALAERSDIDPVIYRGEEEDEAEEQAILGANIEKSRLQNIKEFSEGAASIPAGVLSPDLLRRLEEVEAPDSLMARPEPAAEGPDQDSLLAPTEVEEEV